MNTKSEILNMKPVQFVFTLFWFSSNGLGQLQKSLEDSLDSMITDLHNTYSAKYHLMDADFVRRETDFSDDFGKKLENLIDQIEKKYENKLVEQQRKVNALGKKYERKISNMVSENQLKLLEQERKFSSLMSRMRTSKLKTELGPKQREYKYDLQQILHKKGLTAET